MCGIAGFGSLQMYLNDKRGHQAIDFYGRAPLSVKEYMWLDLIKKVEKLEDSLKKKMD